MGSIGLAGWISEELESLLIRFPSNLKGMQKNKYRFELV